MTHGRRVMHDVIIGIIIDYNLVYIINGIILCLVIDNTDVMLYLYLYLREINDEAGSCFYIYRVFPDFRP